MHTDGRPNEVNALSGYFQRFTSGTVPAGLEVKLSLSDSQALDARPDASLDCFRKIVRGANSGTVYYKAPTGVFANKSATCGEQSARCPGASSAARCEAACSGPGGGLTALTITTATSEPPEALVVELSTGTSGSTHATVTLQLALPQIASMDWRFSSGIDEARDLSPTAAHYRA